MNDWAPKTGSLAGQTLPFSTAPLEPHKADVIILPDLSNPGFTGPGGGGGHGSYGCVYWGLEPGVKGSYKEPKSKTLDQVIGSGLPKTESGRLTLPLHVQLDRAPQSSPAPGSSRCFWLGRGQPINPIGDPYATYMEIFGGAPVGGGANAGAEDPADQAADGPAQEHPRLRRPQPGGLQGPPGQRRSSMSIDAHFKSVRDLEKQLQSARQRGQRRSAAGTPGTMIDLKDGLKYPDILKAHMKPGRPVAQVRGHQRGDHAAQRLVGQQHQLRLRAGHPGRAAPATRPRSATTTTWATTRCSTGVDHKRIVDRWMMQQLADFIVMHEGGPGRGRHHARQQRRSCSAITCRTARTTTRTRSPGCWRARRRLLRDRASAPPSAGKPLNGVMTDICQAMGVPSPFGRHLAGAEGLDHRRRDRAGGSAGRASRLRGPEVCQDPGRRHGSPPLRAHRGSRSSNGRAAATWTPSPSWCGPTTRACASS